MQPDPLNMKPINTVRVKNNAFFFIGRIN
jgi:hypothetical protein